jgi:hypothetical protein
MGEKELVRLCRIECGEDELIPGERYKRAAVCFEDGSQFVLARAESLDGPTDLILVIENLREGAHHEILGILNFTKDEIDLLDNNERREILRLAVMSRYSDDPEN